MSKKQTMPQLGMRAFFQPETLNESARTVELLAATEKRVLTWSWQIGQFYEILDMASTSVDLERANKGAPVLDAHTRYSVKNQLAVIEKAWLATDGVRVLVRFPKAEDDEEADKIFRKVKDGIIRNASAGYRVSRYVKEPPADPQVEEDYPTYRAVKWEMQEVSLLPIGADDDAGTRGQRGEKQELFEVEFLNEINQEEREMKTQTTTQPGAQTTQQATPAATPDTTAVETAAVLAERARAADINDSVRALGLEQTFADGLIANGTAADQARKLAIDEVKKRNPTKINGANPAATSTDIQVGEDQKREAARVGIQNIIEMKFDNSVKMVDQARQFGGFSLRELARESLKASNQPINGNVLEMVGRAMHQTSDFPGLFANVISKRLLEKYARSPRTWQPLVSERDLSDFKAVSVNSVGDFPALKKVNEGGEFENGTFSEGLEQYKLLTYGRIIAVTRQMIINDDIGAILRVIDGIAQSGSNLLSDLVWAIYEGGHNVVKMSDNQYLFHADHKNIAVSNAAVASGLASMRQFLKKQTSLDGDYLNLMPKYIITGVERDDEVEKAQSQRIVPAQASNDNGFISKLQHISDPRLSAAPYFLQAENAPVVEVGYLEGTGRGIYTEQRIGFHTDGIEIKARLDAGVKAIDFRTAVRSAGT